MITQFNRSLQVLIIVLLVPACSNIDLPENNRQALSRSAELIPSVTGDSCSVILIPPTSQETAENKTDKTIIKYQQAVLHSSQPVSQFERLGWAYVQKARETRDAGYYKLAEQVADCIVQKHPDSAESLLLKGHILHHLHQFRNAEIVARRLVEQRGLWFDYALLGDVLLELGALHEAVTAYQRVIDQRPGPQAYTRVAQIRWLKGDLPGAIEMMSKAVRSTSPRSQESAAWTKVRLAQLLIQQDQLSTASALLKQALSLQPDYPPALHASGRLLLAQGQSKMAIPFLEQAVAAEPLPEFRWALIEALQESGQIDNADQQISELLQWGAIEDRRTTALFLATQGDNPATSVRLARQELKQREDVFTLDALAWALSSAGMHDAAEKYSRRALAEGTQDGRLFFHAGVIAARVGDTEQAFELLTRARTIQQMLLPSERQQLGKEFAALQPRISTLVNSKPYTRN